MAGDLHCHTKLSDSSMGIDDLIQLAQKSNLDTIAITDHDCQAGNVRGKIIGERRDITVIPGVELSAFDAPRKQCVHILGYASESPDRLEGLCHKNITAKKRVSQYMMLKVAQRYPITTELVVKCASGSTCIFEQHIMHALMECGLTDTMYGSLYEELFTPQSPTNVLADPRFASPAEVVAAIHDAGGVAVLAHPGKLADEAIIEELLALDIDGIEVWHPAHTEAQTQAFLDFAQTNNLLCTGGSDFHGMYGNGVALGACVTPAAQIKALLSAKAQRKKNNLKR